MRRDEIFTFESFIINGET